MNLLIRGCGFVVVWRRPKTRQWPRRVYHLVAVKMRVRLFSNPRAIWTYEAGSIPSLSASRTKSATDPAFIFFITLAR